MFSTVRTAALAALVAFGAASAHAIPVTYDFTGTLSTPVNGGTSVSGSFTVDKVADTITGFSLTTPYGAATPTNYTASIIQYLPAVSPNADFTQFHFGPDNNLVNPHINLLFESSLANFNGGSLYTAVVQVSGGSIGSEVNCGACFLSTTESSGFASGTATPEGAPVPEPASLTLVAAGLAGLGMARRRRRA